MQNTIAVVDDPLFLEHRATGEHPERPERLEAARAAVESANLQVTAHHLAARDALDEELIRVHSESYLDKLQRAAGSRGYFDADTYYAPQSVAAARRAAGGVVAMADALVTGDARYGVALVRPPGHHARPATAMGFCLLNNVAVGAAEARAKGARRVAIIDWDVHHGNGTQEMFYADPSVLYVSLHQFPFYPGSGAASEIGVGEGTGYTVNVPLSAGAGNEVYFAAFDRLIAPVVEQFDPDLVLISAGFDAHRLDPLAMMRVTEAGYAGMLRRIRNAWRRPGRIGFVLEGGYDLTGLETSLRASLEALDSAADDPAIEPISSRHQDDLERAVSAQKPYWRLD